MAEGVRATGTRLAVFLSALRGEDRARRLLSTLPPQAPCFHRSSRVPPRLSSPAHDGGHASSRDSSGGRSCGDARRCRPLDTAPRRGPQQAPLGPRGGGRTALPRATQLGGRPWCGSSSRRRGPHRRRSVLRHRSSASEAVGCGVTGAPACRLPRVGSGARARGRRPLATAGRAAASRRSRGWGGERAHDGRSVPALRTGTDGVGLGSQQGTYRRGRSAAIALDGSSAAFGGGSVTVGRLRARDHLHRSASMVASPRPGSDLDRGSSRRRADRRTSRRSDRRRTSRRRTTDFRHRSRRATHADGLPRHPSRIRPGHAPLGGSPGADHARRRARSS